MRIPNSTVATQLIWCELFVCECRPFGLHPMRTICERSSRYDSRSSREIVEHPYSMRLNDQFRLIFQIEGSAEGNTIVVLGIEDYH